MPALLLALLLTLLPQSQTGRIEVTVLDGTTDEPVSGVGVTVTFKFPLEPAGPSTTLYSDPRGRLVFSALPTGNYQFNVAGREDLRAPVFPDIWIDPGDQKKVDVRVRRVFTVTGEH
jgi:hypothetical protein